LLDTNDPGFAHAYEYKLTLVRPDQHVAWRGNAMPDLSVIDVIRGARPLVCLRHRLTSGGI